MSKEQTVQNFTISDAYNSQNVSMSKEQTVLNDTMSKIRNIQKLQHLNHMMTENHIQNKYFSLTTVIMLGLLLELQHNYSDRIVEQYLWRYV